MYIVYCSEWTPWYDSYSLLVCDYLCSALPQVSGEGGAVTAAVVKEAVTRLTQHLLSRLGQAGAEAATTAAILALAGGRSLDPDTRSRHHAVLAGDTCPEHVLTRQTGAADTRAPEQETRLPQTDLSSGLLECLARDSAPRDVNIAELMASLNTGPGLVSLVVAQPKLAQYVAAWRQVVAGSPLDIPPLHQDDVPVLAAEVALARRLLSLPLYHAMSGQEMSRMAAATFGCLMSSLASLQLPAEDSLSSLVTDSILLCNTLADICRVSTRLGAAAAMNVTCISAWMIVSGLRIHLSSTMPPACSQLTVSLASHAIACLTSLTRDLGTDQDLDCSPASLELTGQFSGLARLKLVFGAAPVLQLLLQLSSQLYHAAVNTSCSSLEFIPETVHEAVANDNAEALSAVEDGDLLLGSWMTSLLAPTHSSQPGATSNKFKTDSSPMTGSYLTLSSTILTWMSDTLSSSHQYLKVYTMTSLSPDLIHCLSYLLRETSSEAVNDIAAWPDFSAALSTFSRHLISCPLPDPLVSLLLTDLELSPSASVATAWPLAASRRSLALLAQVLLTRAATDSAVFAQYVTIWQRAVASMAQCAASPAPRGDLSLCGVHLLLLIFHSLQLMQKKAVLLSVAQQLRAVCGQVAAGAAPPPAHSCLMLARLAMILDYLVRHLYEPPASLLPQIKKNLFSVGLAEEADLVTPGYITLGPGEEAVYYLLYPSSSNSLHPLDVPKLDGLAVSFLLSTPDAIEYSSLYTGLIASLEPVLSSGAGKAAHYSFLLVWRLLQTLPPPASVLSGLVNLATAMDGEVTDIGYGLTVHCLLLAPRAAHKTFGTWMKDCLVKQGLTTAAAEALVKSVATDVNSLAFEVGLIKDYLDQVEAKPEMSSGDLLLLDCVMAKLQISLDKTFNCTKSGSESPGAGSLPTAVDCAQKLVPCVARLIEKLSSAARTKVIRSFLGSVERGVEPATNSTLLHSICVGGTRCPATTSLALPISSHLPPALRDALNDWMGASITGYPTASAWRNQFANDPIPGESYLASTIAAHATHLSGHQDTLSSPALKHSLFSAARFACDLIIWCPESGPLQQQLVSCLFPLLVDCTTENLADLVTLSLERLVGTGETDQFLCHVYSLVLSHAYPILVGHGATQPHHASSHIPQEIVRFLDMILDKAVGRAALCNFFTAEEGGPKLTEILLSIANNNCVTPDYAQKVLRFFNKLFTMADRHKEEVGTLTLCRQLADLVEVPRPRLEAWLRYLVVGMFAMGSGCQEEVLTENRSLLQSLTQHIVTEESGVPEQVPHSILAMLVPLASDLLSPSVGAGVAFPDLMAVMSGLAAAGGGRGHVTLFPAALEWLAVVKQFMVQKNVIEKLEAGVTAGRHGTMLDNCSHLLAYISDVVVALKYGGGRWGIPSCGAADRPGSPGGEAGQEADEMSWTEEEDEDSGGEESDDELLDGKLCTYIQTARVFMTQHWYHCHTCSMVEGVGCCSVCAR